VTEQDLALIRAASLVMETESYADMLKRLEAATAEGRTFRHTARELLALSAYRTNDATAARQWLDMIGNDARTPFACAAALKALQALLPPAAKKLKRDVDAPLATPDCRHCPCRDVCRACGLFQR
jgi:hypothetical protein